MFNCEHVGSILFKWKCNLIDATVPGQWEIWGEKRKARNPAASQKKQHLAQRCFNRPIKPGCFEPLTRVPGWQMVSPHVPQRVQLLGGSSPEHPLLGHTSLLFLPSGLHLILGRGAELQLLPTSTPFLCSARGVGTEQTPVSAFPSSELPEPHALLRLTETGQENCLHPSECNFSPPQLFQVTKEV